MLERKKKRRKKKKDTEAPTEKRTGKKNSARLDKRISITNLALSLLQMLRLIHSQRFTLPYFCRLSRLFLRASLCFPPLKNRELGTNARERESIWSDNGVRLDDKGSWGLLVHSCLSEAPLFFARGMVSPPKIVFLEYLPAKDRFFFFFKMF